MSEKQKEYQLTSFGLLPQLSDLGKAAPDRASPRFDKVGMGPAKQPFRSQLTDKRLNKPPKHKEKETMFKSNFSRLAILLAVFITLPGLASASDLQVKITNTDGICPSGFALMTFAEAHDNQGQVCEFLGTWYIARLAPHGSMDGPGYDCKVRPSDDRSLGNSICVQAEFADGSGDGHCPDGYIIVSEQTARTNQQAACKVLGAWDIARLAGGGSMDGPGYGCNIRDQDTRPLGNTVCRKAY